MPDIVLCIQNMTKNFARSDVTYCRILLYVYLSFDVASCVRTYIVDAHVTFSEKSRHSIPRHQPPPGLLITNTMIIRKSIILVLIGILKNDAIEVTIANFSEAASSIEMETVDDPGMCMLIKEARCLHLSCIHNIQRWFADCASLVAGVRSSSVNDH